MSTMEPVFTNRDAERLCDVARRMGPDGLAEGTSGNLSVRVGDMVLVTPSGVAYEALSADAICVVDLDGHQVGGEGAPSTELPMHLALYRGTDALAVVHTHSPWATAVSTVADELPAIHYLLAFLGGPVEVVPYATPGTKALGVPLPAALEARSAALLQNHGAVTIGPSLERAYWYAQILEWTAALWSRARLLGQPRLLSPAELAQAAQALRGYGPGKS
jgi:L-fuculose-phosphate aldolase